jgi:UDP-4-amino-4,6-dideoxy-N-acetyl-beta-L-altrosamine transaminase
MTGGRAALPYGRQAVDEDDIAAVVAVLRGDWLTTGPATRAFEAALADRCATSHAIVCANGTAALHLACLALDIGPGDTVIVPAITFAATANAARLAGAEVIFADVDPDSGLMGPQELRAAIARAGAEGHRLKAVLPVHLAGQCAEMTEIAEIARARGLAIIDDACHALGTTYRRHDGAWVPIGGGHDSDLTVLSFHPVKTITSGEGGAVLTRDRRLAERLERLRGHGIVRDPAAFQDRDAGFEQSVANPWYYEMAELGLNYRLSDVNCALGFSQLRKLDRFAAMRRHLADLYDEWLADLAPVLRPVARNDACRPVWHLYSVLVDFVAAGLTRGQLARALAERDIRTQVHYIPVPRQPYYRQRYGEPDLPGADAYYRRTLSLPLFVGMDESDVERVAVALTDLLGAGHGAKRLRRHAL